MGDKNKNRPHVIASFLNANEAHIFRGLLESEGVESFVYHEHSALNTPLLSGIKVAVRERDLERARVILKEIEQELD